MAAAGSVIRLQAEMEGKVKKGREGGQREMGFMLTCCWKGKEFIQSFVETDAITRDPT